MEFQNSKMQISKSFTFAEKTHMNPLPEFFTFRELTRTGTGLDNVPDWESISNLRRLGCLLDCVRRIFRGPIRVNSGFRSKAVNGAVGGVPGSAHTMGLAADICAAEGSESANRRLLDALRESLPVIDQLIVYAREPGNRESPIRFFHVGLASADEPGRNMELWK